MPALIFASLLLAASAPGPLKGAAAAAELDTYRQSLVKDNPKITYEDYRAKVKAKAVELTTDFSLDKTPAEEGYDWGRVLSDAGRYQDSYFSIEKYVATKPAPDDLFKARIAEFNDVTQTEVKDGRHKVSGLDILSKLTVNTDRQALIYASEAQTLADRIDPAKHQREAFHVYDVALKQVSAYPAAKNSLISAKAEDLVSLGKKGEAKRLIADTLKGQDLKDPKLRSLVYLDTRLNLDGAAAPELAFGEKYGDFSGLASLKGKVVILDFYAHWCGPCKASFPDMRKLTDDLGSSVQAVGVTSYYGYFGKEQKLSKADEYARMSGFLEQYKIDHPVIYVEKTEFAKYGVTGIPEFVLIDKKGNVRTLQIGYDAASFAEFRKKVEAAVKE